MEVVRFFRELGMNKRDKADALVREQMLWSLGAGIIPVPVVDVAAVVAVQIRLVQRLCELYGVAYDEQKGKGIISAIIGTSLAGIGASLIKAIPIVGALVGGASLAILSAGGTFAIGQVFIRHFEQGGTLDNLDLAAAKKLFEEELERGKQYAQRLQEEYRAGRTKDAATTVAASDAQAQPITPPVAAPDDTFVKLEKLGQLRDKGLITEAEFQAKKQQLLETL